MIRPVETNNFQYLDNMSLPLPDKVSAGAHPQSQFPPEIDGVTGKESPTSGSKIDKKLFRECETCERRKFKDVSNDPSVSFKTPTSVAPGAEAYAVAAHENQHVSHEKGKAMREGKEVVYQSVQIHTAVCPECGRVYVSGGKTTTAGGPQEMLGRNLTSSLVFHLI
jgi:hypothetical protein